MFVCALAWTAPAAAQVTYNKRTGLYEPPLAELKTVAARGDRADLARWAARLGPARLAQALRSTDSALVMAATEATTLLPGNVRLLDAVTALLVSPDGAVTERAARALGQMLDGAHPREVEEWEVPADVVARACRALVAFAGTAAAPVDARLAAVGALAEATSTCRSWAAAGVAPLARDPHPEIRRAALLAGRPDHDAFVTAARDSLAATEPRVAAAAAVALCRRRVSARAEAAVAAGARMRELAAAEDTPVEDAAEILPCLAASGDAEDRRTLERIRDRRSGPLRDRAAELLRAR